jgi:predicted nucleotidyltransferase
MNAALDVPTINRRIRIPSQAIQSVVDQIATLFQPQKIILFGSYAHGTPGPEIDIDLLVVMDTPFSEVDQAVKILRSIQYRFGIDLIVQKPGILAQRLDWGDSFLKEVVLTGKVVYEAADPRMD